MWCKCIDECHGICIQAFRLCKSGLYNLSFESITSVEATRALRDIQLKDPDRWAKICLREKQDPNTADGTTEEEPFQEDVNGDDSALTVSELVECIAAEFDGSPHSSHVVAMSDGHFGLAEDLEQVVPIVDVSRMDISEVIAQIEGYGRGKRKKLKNRRYEGNSE